MRRRKGRLIQKPYKTRRSRVEQTRGYNAAKQLRGRRVRRKRI